MKFTNLLKTVILENSRFKLLYDRLVQKDAKDKKEGKKIPFEIFKKIVFADPDTKKPEGFDVDNATPETMENVKIGKYTQWLLKNFISPASADIDAEVGTPEYKRQVKAYQELFLEDIYKTTEDLKKFERFKGQLPQEARDINKLDKDQLFELVKDFKLEKTKATKQEKEEAAATYAHPGADIVFRGNNWTVAKISRGDSLGKNAACFYGGQHEYDKDETRWCTSSPGLNWFERYIKDGPLYVVLPNKGSKLGQVSKLPVERYQFHFPSGHFMDRSDRSVDLVKFLNGEMAELKEFFKPEFRKGLSSNIAGGNKLDIKIPGQAVAKFIALYGLEEIMNDLPKDLVHILIDNTSNDDITIDIPASIGELTNLRSILLKNVVSSIPDTICNCKELEILALSNNKKLKSIPDCIAKLPNLSFLNLQNTPVELSKAFEDRVEPKGNGMYYVL